MVSSGEHIYFIRDRIVARGPARGFGPDSVALCCTTCGAAGWGRIMLVPSGGAPQPWRFISAICPDCPPRSTPWFPAGSFVPAYLLFSTAIGEECPGACDLHPDILVREAKLHLDYAARIIADSSD